MHPKTEVQEQTTAEEQEQTTAEEQEQTTAEEQEQTTAEEQEQTTAEDQRIFTRGNRYQIPHFKSLLTYYANPFDKQLSLMNEWMDWMFPFSCLPKDHYERRIRQAIIMVTSYMFPFCNDIKRFERLFKWFAYLFICDDHIEFGRDNVTTRWIMDEAKDCMRRLEAIHVNGDVHDVSLSRFKPYSVCIYFVAEDILLDMTMEQRKRFLKNWHSYNLSLIEENKLIELLLLDLDAINKNRLDSGAVRTLFALIEYSQKIHLSDHLWHDDRMLRLMDLCILCTVYVNDVYSFEKEYVDQNEDMTKMVVNIVGYHVLKYKYSVEEAFERSLVIIREYESNYKQLADSLLNDPSINADSKKFIECVTAINAGNYALSIHCMRFDVNYETK